MSFPPVLALSLPVNNANDPRYLVEAGTGYDGVVLLEFPDRTPCTGTLLHTGRHILTAAHCFEVQPGKGQPTKNPDPDAVQVIFHLPQGEVQEVAAAVYMHPQWMNQAPYNNNIAVIALKRVAPLGAERYAIYRDVQEVGQRFVRVGYGVPVSGQTGMVQPSERPMKRFGGNRYDGLGEVLNQPPISANIESGTQLLYDLDSGFRFHDALGLEYGLFDVGLLGTESGVESGLLTATPPGKRSTYETRIEEAGTSPGDGGSPAFLDGKVVGIASWGLSPKTAHVDVTPRTDSSFGEYFLDTRVSAYREFIDGVLEGEVPSPGAAGLDLLQLPVGGVVWGLVGAIALYHLLIRHPHP